MNTSHAKLLAIILASFLTINHLQANNGVVNYAYPMDAITVDGDLSDWPSDIKPQPIETFLFGSEIQGKEDLQASYRLGYCLATKMLYVAVTTIDDDIMGDPTDKAEWNTHDIHNFYVDPAHTHHSGAISHLVSPDFRRIAENRPQESWDPQVRNATWDHVAIEIKREGNQTTYEWSFYLGDQLEVGRTIGFDYEVLDKDTGEDGFPSVLALSPGSGKAFNGSRMADLVLMEPETKLGTLKGKLLWEGETKPKVPGIVRIHARNNSNFWVAAKVNDKGVYTAELPIGEYEITLPYKVRFGDEEAHAVMNPEQYIHASVTSAKTSKASDFAIEMIPMPAVIPQEGLLAQFSSDQAKKVDEFMATMMAYYDVPGASLALVKDGEVAYHQTYGYKNTYTKDPVTKETLFEAASVTKPVFAFAVNRLVERGEFDLDKPLHEYLPFEDIASDDRYKLMTGRHVLTHVSGLPNWGREMKETPGTKFGYSGEGFEYLKRVVAHVTGRDIEELVTEEVLKPMGVSHTYFSKSDELVKVVANGHFDNQPTIFDIPAEPGMAHSMYTEAGTFANFMIGLLDRKGLKSSTYEEMFRPQTELESDKYSEAIGRKESFGLGIVSAETPQGKMYGHGGNNGDFRCQFEIFDEGKMGFAVFTNGNTGHLLVKALREFLIMGEVVMASK